MKRLPSYLGIYGPGILYIKDRRKFLDTPAAQRQINAARRLATPSEESKCKKY